MEKFDELLEEASKTLQTADHMIYVTFPLLKENRLLLKILDQIHTSLVKIINAILQYEYYYKRIELYQDTRENFRTFKETAERYNITEQQVKKINEILSLGQKHKASPFEFVKNDKVVIMSDNLKTDTITKEKIKELLIETKDILRKASIIIKKPLY